MLMRVVVQVLQNLLLCFTACFILLVIAPYSLKQRVHQKPVNEVGGSPEAAPGRYEKPVSDSGALSVEMSIMN